MKVTLREYKTKNGKIELNNNGYWQISSGDSTMSISTSEEVIQLMHPPIEGTQIYNKVK